MPVLTPAQQRALQESTAAAQSAARSIGGTFQQGVGYTPGQPPAIRTDTLTSPIPSPYVLPATGQTPSTTSSLYSYLDTLNDPSLKSAAGTAGALFPEDQAKRKTAADLEAEYVKKLTGKQGVNELTSDAYAPEVDPAKKEYDRVKSEYESLTQSYRKRIEAALKVEGGTTAGAQAAADNIQRQATSELADKAIILNAVGRDYDRAKEIADRAVAIKLEKQTNELEAFKYFSEKYGNELKEKDKQRLAFIIDERTRLLDVETKKLGDIQKLAITAIENYAPASVASAMQKAKTVEEALRIGAPYLRDEKRQLELQKLRDEIKANKPITGEFANVINGAVNLVGATKGKTVKTAIANAIVNKDYPTAYAEIANAVEDSLTGTNKTKFADSRTDIGVMSSMRDAIKEYADAGGNLGYLKGSADNIAKKFGQLSTDPKFAALGVRLAREFQAYRLSMTGAAFSPAESKEYAAVNPRTSASLDLNLATIDGALDQLRSRVVSTVNQRLPDAQKIYDLSTGKKETSSVQDPAFTKWLKDNGF